MSRCVQRAHHVNTVQPKHTQMLIWCLQTDTMTQHVIWSVLRINEIIKKYRPLCDGYIWFLLYFTYLLFPTRQTWTHDWKAPTCYPVVNPVWGDEKRSRRNSSGVSRGEGGEMVAGFPACPHMTVLRPGPADAATLCACHGRPSTADEAVSRTVTLFWQPLRPLSSERRK